MNHKLTTGVPQLHPISVKAPWYMIGIDFIGPVSPEAEDDSKYILTVSDYFTEWVEAIPTIDNKAVTVAAVLFKASCCIMRIQHNTIILCIALISDFHADGSASCCGV